MDMAPDRYRFVLRAPVVREPGKRWIYNGGATALLARIIARGTGKPLHEFAREALFDPLEIGPTEWLTDDHGEAFAASGLRMVPRDLARIGVMMLKGGMWGDRQRRAGAVDRALDLTHGRYRRDPTIRLPMVSGQIRFYYFDEAAVGPVAARARLVCSRQWRPAALCVSWARSGRGHNSRQL